jgi:hypothetical protein
VEEHQRRLASVKLRGAHVHARTFVCDAAITGTQGAGAMLASDVLPLRFAGLFASRRALLALILAAGGSGQPLLAMDGQRDGPHDGQPPWVPDELIPRSVHPRTLGMLWLPSYP